MAFEMCLSSRLPSEFSKMQCSSSMWLPISWTSWGLLASGEPILKWCVAHKVSTFSFFIPHPSVYVPGQAFLDVVEQAFWECSILIEVDQVGRFLGRKETHRLSVLFDSNTHFRKNGWNNKQVKWILLITGLQIYEFFYTNFSSF